MGWIVVILLCMWSDLAPRSNPLPYVPPAKPPYVPPPVWLRWTLFAIFLAHLAALALLGAS